MHRFQNASVLALLIAIVGVGGCGSTTPIGSTDARGGSGGATGAGGAGTGSGGVTAGGGGGGTVDARGGAGGTNATDARDSAATVDGRVDTGSPACASSGDCVLYDGVGDGCCGVCQPRTDPTPPPIQCLVACMMPLKSCTCVNGRCVGLTAAAQ